MSTLRPFPADSTTIAISVTSASSDTVFAIPGNSGRFVNEGPNNCYISVGVGAVQTATVPGSSGVRTSTPLLAGSDVILTIPYSTALHVGAICRGSQTATVIVSTGEGD